MSGLDERLFFHFVVEQEERGWSVILRDHKSVSGKGSTLSKALGRAQAGALREAARQIVAGMVSPQLDYVFFAVERRVDATQRERIIFGQVPKWSDVPSGILPFRDLGGSQFDRLLEAGCFTANNGLKGLSTFLHEHPDFSAWGFVVSPTRSDTRIEIEGVNKPGEFTPDEKQRLKRLRAELHGGQPENTQCVVPIRRGPNVRPQALLTVAAELDGSTRAPLGAGVCFQVMLSKDTARRDRILFGRVSTDSRERFDRLTVENLGQLLELNLCDPMQRQGDSPTIEEIFEHMQKYGGCTAFGFVRSQEEGGVVIEGVQKDGAIAENEQRAFRRRFKGADAIVVSATRLYCWFD